MSATSPEDVDRLFAERLNAGDIDGVLALYEPDALLAGAEPAAGVDAIRDRVAAMVEGEFSLECNVITAHVSGDLALLYNDWRGTHRGPCGERLGVAGKAIEVVRRQPGGSWRFVIDDPFGRG